MSCTEHCEAPAERAGGGLLVRKDGVRTRRGDPRPPCGTSLRACGSRSGVLILDAGSTRSGVTADAVARRGQAVRETDGTGTPWHGSARSGARTRSASPAAPRPVHPFENRPPARELRTW